MPALDMRDLPRALADTGASGNVEADKDEVYRELGKAYREEEKRQREKVQRNSDGSYYFTIVCASADQASALQACLTGASEFMEYVDGRVIAHQLGVEVEDDGWKPRPPRGDTRLASLIAPELDPKS